MRRCRHGELVWQKNDFPGKWPGSTPDVAPGGRWHGDSPTRRRQQRGIRRLRPGRRHQKWKWAGDGATYGSPVLMTVDGTKGDRRPDQQADGGPRRGRRQTPLGSPVCGRNGLQCRHADRRRANADLFRAGPGHQGREVREEGRRRRGDQLWSSPARLAVQHAGAQGWIVFGLSDKGNFFCIDAKTGKTTWTDA